MASDHPFPMSRPYPGWGPGPNTPIEPPQTPSSAVMDKLQTYTPDVYTGPPAIQPSHPYPMQPSRLNTKFPPSRPESPAQVGRPPSRSAWSVPQAPEGPSPVQRTYKTFLQWKADAQARSAECLRNGFPSPVAWVYVEGHAIPPNAIVGGVDRRGPWHIARTFYEGSMELGKAGRHLRLGACISYHGKERDVDAYEVLIEVNIPTRWMYQPLPTAASQVTIADFKLVVIIDDSDSMDGPLWFEACDALAGVAELSRLKGGDGLDLYCLNSPQHKLDLRAESEVRSFFNNLTPEGQTPTGARLKQILDIYVPRIEDPTLRHKPVSILVITDGVPTDDPRSVIVNFARRLDAKNVPLRQLGIQFVQIGDDPDATAALKELDDNLGPTHGVRDMVDTTLFSHTEPHLRSDVIVKAVLGSINTTLDNKEFPAPVLRC